MKVDRTSDLQLQSLKQRQQEQEVTSGKQSVQSSDQIDLPKPVRVGQSVVYVSLSKSLSLNGKAFDATGNSSSSSSALTGGVEPTEDNPLGFDYKAVAKSVLGFVTGYIKSAQSQGKDEKELQDLLEQARKGIDKGFGSARDELKGMSMLSEDLDKGIEKSYTLIQDELHKFEEDLFGLANDDEGTSAVSGSRQAQALGFSSSSQASLDITTKDGDKVSIRFDDQENWRLQQQSRYSVTGRKAVEAYGSGNEASALGNRSETGTQHNSKSDSSSSSIYYSRTQGFSFSVDGDLDVDELKSIGSLIDQVGSLSDTFFSGDLDGALKQAKALSLDDKELVGMSLSLRQSQAAALEQKSAKAASTADASDVPPSVSTASGEQTSSTTDSGQLFVPFTDYLARLQDMIAQANSLFDRDKQGELNAWVLGQQQGLQGEALTQANEQFSSFNQRMEQALAAYNG